ncbi:MAG: shikimate kinase [Bryobacteraceae bacterium]|nr:shikimate kinase [Bryobacteraceae bacterium]MDW8378532.1 shikimate kinase [Bryobacterales bacterium]
MNLKLKRTPGIYLVGFMGCGKSTVGKKLAAELGWTFVDLDEDIEAEQGMSIAQIFAEKGEAEFRAIESRLLAERIQQIRSLCPLVLALGGGAFVQPQNLALILANGVSIWLDCPWEKIKQRVAENNDRPLARDPERFEELFRQRRAAYAQADYRIEIRSDDPVLVVQEILAIPGLFDR